MVQLKYENWSVSRGRFDRIDVTTHQRLHRNLKLLDIIKFYLITCSNDTSKVHKNFNNFKENVGRRRKKDKRLKAKGASDFGFDHRGNDEAHYPQLHPMHATKVKDSPVW